MGQRCSICGSDTPSVRKPIPPSIRKLKNHPSSTCTGSFHDVPPVVSVNDEKHDVEAALADADEAYTLSIEDDCAGIGITTEQWATIRAHIAKQDETILALRAEHGAHETYVLALRSYEDGAGVNHRELVAYEQDWIRRYQAAKEAMSDE